jgi:hypothetical protein
MRPRSALAVLVLTLPLVAAAATAQPPPQGCDGSAYRAFDFWLGEWEVETPDGTRAGENRIEAKIGGCALVESWSGAGGSIGTSLNSYDRADGKWHQIWVDGQGGRLVLSGGIVGDRMVMSGKVPAATGGFVLHEISWQPLADGAVRQHWRSSSDNGATWQDLFVGIYRKKTPTAGG